VKALWTRPGAKESGPPGIKLAGWRMYEASLDRWKSDGLDDDRHPLSYPEGLFS
jgi:hypothetical protein